MMLLPVGRDPAPIEEILTTWSGELAFDIGGNAGRVAAELATRFERVVSCEPAAESYAELAQVAERLANIEALNVAISDVNGQVKLDVQEHPIQSGQLTSPVDGAEGWGRVIGTRTVSAVTLDALAERYGAPDAVKVDVEGHELRVICGGLATLRAYTPRLYIEIHNAGLGAQIAGFLQDAYGDLHTVRHPHYPPGSWGHDNHYYLIAGAQPPALVAPRRPLMPLGRKETAVARKAVTRDIEADYRNAYIAEYQGYRRTGRTEAAENVAQLLREQYGHEVNPASDAEPGPEAPKEPEPALETAAATPPPETAVPPKPRRTPARRQAKPVKE